MNGVEMEDSQQLKGDTSQECWAEKLNYLTILVSPLKLFREESSIQVYVCKNNKDKTVKSTSSPAMTNGRVTAMPAVIMCGRASTCSKCDMLYLRDVMAAGDKQIYHWGGMSRVLGCLLVSHLLKMHFKSNSGC